MRSKRAKMEDVAREAGVSAMTVSRALRPDGLVSAETRARILAAVHRLDYAPNDNARALSRGRSGFVVLLVPSLNNPHFGGTVKALSEAVEASGLQVLVGHTNYEAEREERLVEALLRRRPEAVVLTADSHTIKTREMLARSGVPVIEIWDRQTRPIGHPVGFSNRAAARAMTEYLIKCGYRNIVYLGEHGDRGTRGSRRRLGFADAIEAAGLGPPRMLAVGQPPVAMSEGRSGLGEALDRWPDTDALFCVSDPCAFGALMEAQRRGLSVPGDLGIAGFGDFDIGRCSQPALTTVVISAEQIGRVAGEKILRLLKGDTDPSPDQKITYKVLARGSTADLSISSARLSRKRSAALAADR